MKSRQRSILFYGLIAPGALAATLIGGRLIAAPSTPKPQPVEASASGVSKPTYYKDVQPILARNCVSCHQAGEVAPFSLTTYTDARDKATTLTAVTKSRYMPPWKADSHGEFVGERRLTAGEIATLQTWAAQGAPEGTKTGSAPVAAPAQPGGWHMGTPDAVIQPTESYSIPAEGDDIYRCFVLPTNYGEDRYLSGFEVHPGNRRIVHHVLAFVDTSGVARQKDAADPGPGFTSFGGPGFTPSGALGGWAPGMEPHLLPTGVGIPLPKGADIVLQVHYHKDGKPETDRTQIGLFFSKAPIDKQVRYLPVADPLINIPPSDKAYTAKMGVVLPADITVLSVTPHMHLLGHDMTVTETPPSGDPKQMVRVDDYDFNWQTTYAYKQPMSLSKGTSVNLVAHYDNSADNARNPNSPPKPVRWGEQTTDEMCIAFLSYTLDDEHLTKGVESTNGGAFRAAMGAGLMQETVRVFDKNGDGALDENELVDALAFLRERAASRRNGQAAPGAGADPHTLTRRVIGLLDRNGDGKLDASEMSGLTSFLSGRSGGGLLGGF